MGCEHVNIFLFFGYKFMMIEFNKADLNIRWLVSCRKPPRQVKGFELVDIRVDEVKSG